MAEPAQLGVRMFVAYRALERRAHQAAVEAGGELTPSQARLAARIGPDGTRLTDLAAQAQVTKQTAGHLIDQLERSGYVERVRDQEDGRARLVRLTAEAAPLVAAGNAAVSDELERWREHLGAERMLQLEEALTMLQEITDP